MRPGTIAALVVVWTSACGSQHGKKDDPVVEPPVTVVTPTPLPAATPATTAAIQQLASESWIAVSTAQTLLAGEREAALAGLVAMVERDDRVPLVGTADLIYPGAKEFYGHGFVVPYDLDHLGDRAGWVLEGLVFRDFGFSDGVPATGAEDPAHATTRRAAARAAVKAWWQTARTSWRCYDALVEAMGGLAPGLAYQWLRGWQSPPCTGFTADAFRRDLLPIVQRHAADAAHPMQRQAELLLRDADTQLARLVTIPLGLVLARLNQTTATTTVAELQATLGVPTGDVGSGIHILVYAVADGGEVRVGTPDGTSVMYIRFTQHGRERVLYDAQK